ncbi:hypothetical protein GCM10010401_05210 [Rarobacter faecitabidus]|uniref:Uncharacterized protein n=1 Tax=Rarobacter faecitabidus TaxID=13243 RepID=A0A542ZTN9_RARFA|nr:hypothetical protein [Rarobacter faecitabidus]TQL63728.1 hypothetical protein FB461_0199 [Rarobacter faecitabidus]
MRFPWLPKRERFDGRAVSNELLQRLVGRRLNSIQFTKFYVQFWFDGDEGTIETVTFHCGCFPRVLLGDVTLTESDPTYAGALLACLDEEVISADAEEATGITVAWPSGTIRLRPTAEEAGGYEIAVLDVPSAGFVVWNSEDFPFQNLD